MQYRKFVKWETVDVKEIIEKAPIPKAISEWEKGNKNPLKELHLVKDTKYYRNGGWEFYLPMLKTYWVKTKYYGIVEYYSLCKSDIRKELKSNCIKIIEIS